MSIPVTVILPTLNERAFISSCLHTLINQDYSNISEILVIDGGSTDGTQEIVRSFGGVVRLLDNPRMTAAAAMNIGISEATNDVFVRVDAHSHYEMDYVSKSVEAFVSAQAQVVGGPMRPVGTTPFGKAVAVVTSSPLGIGPGKFHYSETRQEVDTVYLGIFDRDFVNKVGGYDEVNLQWAAEDQELNYRIRKAGGRIVLDPAIRSTYFPRDNPRSLARQYHNYGMCKASTLAKHKTLPYWRPLVPAFMVLGTICWMLFMVITGQYLFALFPFVLYLVASSMAGVRLAREKEVAGTNVSLALTICHWGYGVGFWRGVLRIVTRRKFDSKPKGGRR
jgi:glycosyltransferase involved in cell wall biosynthesis